MSLPALFVRICNVEAPNLFVISFINTNPNFGNGPLVTSGTCKILRITESEVVHGDPT